MSGRKKKITFGDLHLLAQSYRSNDGLHLRLVDDGEIPTISVDERLSKPQIQNQFVEMIQGHSNDDICQTQSLANQKSSSDEMLIEGLQDFSDISFRSLSSLWGCWSDVIFCLTKNYIGIVGDLSKNRECPDASRKFDLIDSKIDPVFNRSLFE
jgi:hypothetical protein